MIPGHLNKTCSIVYMLAIFPRIDQKPSRINCVALNQNNMYIAKQFLGVHGNKGLSPVLVGLYTFITRIGLTNESLGVVDKSLV